MPRYDIRGDLLEIDGRRCAFRQARDVGGRIVPTLIVLHDTAGGLNADGSISWLAGNPGKTSAHFVVGRDGTITQLAPADRKCNHAGKSVWRGREMCNGFSIGIEIVNPGKLLARGDGAVSSVGHVYDRAQYGIGRALTPAHGDGFWMPYTAAQIAAVEGLVGALARAFPTITEVVGHYDISPGRKVDPTPLMDWQRMRAALAKAKRVAPAPAPATDSVDVLALQQRLADLGYNPGLADGVMGTRTSAALFAFQRENGLPTSGKIDAATVAALGADDAKPMPTGHREEATLKDLADAGSQTAHAAAADRKEGAWQASLAATSGTLVVVKSAVSDATSISSMLPRYAIEAALVVACCVAAFYGVRQMIRGTWLGQHRLAEHRDGTR